MKKYLRFMFQLTEGYRKLYLLQLSLIVISIFLTMLSSYTVKIVIDCYTETNGVVNIYQPSLLGPIGNFIVLIFGGPDFIMNNKWILAIGVIGFGLLGVGSFIVRGLIRGHVNTGISKRIRLELFNHIERLPYSVIKTHNNGDFLQTCMRDEQVLREFVTWRFNQLFQTLMTMIISFTILCTIEWRLALVSIAAIPLLILYSAFVVKKDERLYRATDDSEAVVIGKIEENINSIRVVKAYNNERYEIDEFNKDLKDYKDKFKHWRKFSMLFIASSDILVFGQIIATGLVGGAFTYFGDITVGTMVIATTYTASVIWPVRECINTIIDYAKATVSIDRMMEIFNTPYEDLDKGDDFDIEGDIEFNNVSFAFDDDKENPVIKNLSFKIKKGMTVAFMGKTGSGKSTTAHLLTKLYDYDSGSIKIDGVELKDISKRCVRRNISMVLQEPFLFSRTVLENLRIKEKDAPMDKIVEATSTADMHKTIEGFSSGYDTLIGERGTTLSGGQKQRIAMARTLLNESPIVIFDDSLSAVDAETDVRIRTALKHRQFKSTNLIITHRVMTAQNADLIVVFENGTATEIGTHKELINKHGFYEKIYKIQTRIE